MPSRPFTNTGKRHPCVTCRHLCYGVRCRPCCNANRRGKKHRQLKPMNMVVEGR